MKSLRAPFLCPGPSAFACAALASLLGLLSGCSSFNLSFHRSPPVISKEEAPHAFRGLVDLAYNQDQDGKPVDPVPVRMFMLHGIGQHELGWAKSDYLDSFIKDPQARKNGWGEARLVQGGPFPIRWKERDPGNKDAKIDYPAPGFCGEVQVYTISDGAGKIRLVAYEVTWSSLTKPFKQRRFKDKNSAGTDDESQFRPLGNQMVRTILDENMADVVLYARDFDDNIIGKTVSHALESFYGGTHDPGAPSPDSEELRRAPTFFLTQSLGSILLDEALAAHVGDTESHPGVVSVKMDSASTNALENTLSNLGTVFMMANQIALLDMPAADKTGNVVPAPVADPQAVGQGTPFKALAKARDSARARRSKPVRPVTIAAFNDLYDDLSYRVSPDSVRNKYSVIDNFYPTNAPAWIWPFRIAEDPSLAHNNYGQNPEVYDLVMEGYAPP
jgi:hypothetical protein